MFFVPGAATLDESNALYLLAVGGTDDAAILQDRFFKIHIPDDIREPAPRQIVPRFFRPPSGRLHNGTDAEFVKDVAFRFAVSR